MLELAILGLLTEEPLHGYELKKQLADMLGFASGVSFGSLYPALGRLESAGAVAVLEASEDSSSSSSDAPGRAGKGRRGRKVYRITDSGRSLFDELLAAENTANDDDKVFAVRLAFARHLPPDARIGMLERRRARLADRLAHLAARVRAGVDRLDGYGRSLAEHDRDRTAHDLDWIDRLIARERAARSGAIPDVGAARSLDPSAAATGESVTPESVTPESVTPESVTPESVTPESVTPESVPGRPRRAPAPTISSLRPPGHRTEPRPGTTHGRTTSPHEASASVHPGAHRPAATATAGPIAGGTAPNPTGEEPATHHLEDPTP